LREAVCEDRTHHSPNRAEAADGTLLGLHTLPSCPLDVECGIEDESVVDGVRRGLETSL
jgi:hypothetical protein